MAKRWQSVLPNFSSQQSELNQRSKCGLCINRYKENGMDIYDIYGTFKIKTCYRIKGN